MRPGPAVEVIRSDDRPGIVHDADLGVHVDRRSCLVFRAVDGDPVAGGLPQHPHCVDPADQVRRPGQAPAGVRIARDDRDQAERGGQRPGESIDDDRRP